MAELLVILTPIALIDSSSIVPPSLVPLAIRAAATWGARVILMLLLALGTVMILDGVGWFLGRPLIRIGL